MKTVSASIGYKKGNSVIIIQNNVNIELKSGCLTVLIGENGIGKSTLLKTITGILPTLQGNVLLDNLNINFLNSIELAKKISVVLTEKIPDSELSIYDIIASGRQPYTNWLGKISNDDELIIQNAIKQTNLETIQHKKHFEVSDGQLQKALIARAIAQNTNCIILDEPTTHLDLFHKISVFKLLKKIAFQTNKKILLSTHDLDLAIAFADEIIVMKKEKTIQNTTENLIKNKVFETFFNDKSIQFNAEKRKFEYLFDV